MLRVSYFPSLSFERPIHRLMIIRIMRDTIMIGVGRGDQSSSATLALEGLKANDFNAFMSKQIVKITFFMCDFIFFVHKVIPLPDRM